MRRSSGICSLPVRVIFETLLILLFFIPLFLFVSKWPNVETIIHDKVLAVNKFYTKKSQINIFL
jgi:hypothetical protein